MMAKRFEKTRNHGGSMHICGFFAPVGFAPIRGLEHEEHFDALERAAADELILDPAELGSNAVIALGGVE